MHELTKRILRLNIWKDCQGQDMLEYALASGIIALGGVAAIPVYCSAINLVFSKISETILNSIH